MVLTKKHWILIGVVVLAVLLGGSLIYFNWSKQKAGLANQPQQPKQESQSTGSQMEQTELEPIRKVIIPSSLSVKDIASQFGPSPYPFYYEWAENREDFSQMEERKVLGIGSPSEDFIEMLVGTWLKVYSKKDGTKVYGISEEIPMVFVLYIIKYETPESLQEDYTKISLKHELRDVIIEGAKVKTEIGLPPEIYGEFKSGLDPEDLKPEYFEPDPYKQYLLHSNNFIIYTYGLKEAAKDIMIRVIDQYTVE